MFKDTASPGTTLQDVMATSLSTTTPDAKKDELASIFKEVRLPGSCRTCHHKLRLPACLPACLSSCLSVYLSGLLAGWPAVLRKCQQS